MAYITLKELKDILPIILEQWIDEDDESWEWIFNEIEQKCHVIQWINPIDTKQKGKKSKKWKKHIENDICQMKSMVDTHSVVFNGHRNDIDRLTKEVDELSNKVSNLSSSDASMESRINALSRDVAATKSLAETAKRRTEVDYTQMSKVKNDAEVIQDVYNRIAGRGATKEELDTFRNVIHKYDALEKKSIDILKKECKTCKTCKYYTNREAGNGMHNSELDCYSIIGPCVNYSKWEVKDDG